MLDADSRAYSANTRMWVATCPRCHFAVAWNPRRAREAARTWTRIRALNNRFGTALVCGFFSGVLSCATAGIALETVARLPPSSLGFELYEDPALLILSCITAALATCCGMSFAPHRGTVVRLGLAWLAGSLPVSFAMCIVAALAAPLDFDDLRQYMEDARVGAFAIIFTVPLLSLVMLALIASPIHTRAVRFATRRFRRLRRETMAQFHPAHHS